MALQSSGPISINDIAAEFGCDKDLLACAQAAGLSTTGIQLSDFYGLSASTHILTIGTDNQNNYGFATSPSILVFGGLSPNQVSSETIYQFYLKQNGSYGQLEIWVQGSNSSSKQLSVEFPTLGVTASDPTGSVTFGNTQWSCGNDAAMRTVYDHCKTNLGSDLPVNIYLT